MTFYHTRDTIINPNYDINSIAVDRHCGIFVNINSYSIFVDRNQKYITSNFFGGFETNMDTSASRYFKKYDVPMKIDTALKLLDTSIIILWGNGGAR